MVSILPHTRWEIPTRTRDEMETRRPGINPVVWTDSLLPHLPAPLRPVPPSPPSITPTVSTSSPSTPPLPYEFTNFASTMKITLRAAPHVLSSTPLVPVLLPRARGSPRAFPFPRPSTLSCSPNPPSSRFSRLMVSSTVSSEPKLWAVENAGKEPTRDGGGWMAGGGGPRHAPTNPVPTPASLPYRLLRPSSSSTSPFFFSFP